MDSGEFIQRKLQAWARRKGLSLQGSEGERGRRNYTMSVEENLFGNTIDDDVRGTFEAGAGGELRGAIPSMSALHSSAAMVVNLFQYWLSKRQFSALAVMLDIPSIGIASAAFERKYPVCDDWTSRGFTEPPHLDLGIDYGDGMRVGVECKLFEPYGRLDHTPLRAPYLALPDAWADIPACHALGCELGEGDAGFRRLGASQLLRHILGLKFGTPAGKARLVYLYYDAPGPEAEEHRAEIRQFQERIAPDSLRFVPMTVQEVVLRAEKRFGDDHKAYVDYLTERYL